MLIPFRPPRGEEEQESAEGQRQRAGADLHRIPLPPLHVGIRRPPLTPPRPPSLACPFIAL